MVVYAGPLCVPALALLKHEFATCRQKDTLFLCTADAQLHRIASEQLQGFWIIWGEALN